MAKAGRTNKKFCKLSLKMAAALTFEWTLSVAEWGILLVSS